ncbi:hypothetical protein [uncultured Parabacteroides sp.]|jgi:hypothetical protein|uniref:hypothetical protein n=1 Tax=uncultured Parabacteroides sp. TaxID=512312 RepID=UPI0025D418C8|nr:hypothetical protein [uncultured Parabacteroides sp.]
MKIKNRYVGGWYLSVFVLLGTIMAACSDSDGDLTDPLGQKLVLRAFSEKLSGEVSFADSVFFAKGNESGKYTDIWKARVKADGSTSLTEPKYYPSDNSRIYLRGFAPEGRLAGEGRIAYSIDGRQDLLVTDEQNGSLTDMFWQEGKSFRFTHLLSQLRFQFRCDEAGKEKGWKLFGLVAEGVQCDAVLSMPDKGLTFSGEQKGVVVLDRMAGGECLPLDTDWVDMSEMVMIQPGVAVGLTVILEDRAGNLTRFERLPVSFHETDGYPASGTSYLLSVVLRADGACSLSAQVSEWKRGNNGTGVID